jgi:glycosyltransferase involved in cell wall biosynthesis
MTIAFVTTQGAKGSTLIGRVIPLAEHMSQYHHVHVLAFDHPTQLSAAEHTNVVFHESGHEPFERTANGKKRARGLALLWLLFTSTLKTTRLLFQLKPDVVIIVKPLPHNVAAVTLWRAWPRKRRPRIILDCDDLELTANVLSSLSERAAIHIAERLALTLAHHVVVATPFLQDRMRHLTARHPKPVTHIPTGIATMGTLAAKKTEPTLVYLGSLSQSSGHRVDLLPAILKAVQKKVPRAKLLIAGIGDNENELRSHLTGNDSVTWKGKFTTQDIPALLHHKAILLDPIDDSFTQRAKSSFRVTLASYLGLPVVTSNIGIRPLLLPAQLHNRFFAKPGDAVSYAHRVQELIDHPLTSAEKAQLQKHGQNFTWEKLAQQYLNIITHD